MFRVIELLILNRVLTIEFVNRKLVMYDCILNSGYLMSLTFECSICFKVSSLKANDLIFFCITNLTNQLFIT